MEISIAYERSNNYAAIFNVTFFGHSIEVTVTNNPESVAAWIGDLTGPRFPGGLVVGLDSEWRPNFQPNSPQNRVAVLQLCVGNKCLVFQLQWAPYIPQSLVDFLGNGDYTFVGVGIADDVQRLGNDWGLWVSKVVDLRTLASQRTCNPALRQAGLTTLASEVLGIRYDKPKNITLSNWENQQLSTAQIQYASIDAFLSSELGTYGKRDLPTSFAARDNRYAKKPRNRDITRRYYHVTTSTTPSITRTTTGPVQCKRDLPTSTTPSAARTTSTTPSTARTTTGLVQCKRDLPTSSAARDNRYAKKPRNRDIGRRYYHVTTSTTPSTAQTTTGPVQCKRDLPTSTTPSAARTTSTTPSTARTTTGPVQCKRDLPTSTTPSAARTTSTTPSTARTTTGPVQCKRNLPTSTTPSAARTTSTTPSTARTTTGPVQCKRDLPTSTTPSVARTTSTTPSTARTTTGHVQCKRDLPTSTTSSTARTTTGPVQCKRDLPTSSAARENRYAKKPRNRDIRRRYYHVRPSQDGIPPDPTN